MLKTPCITWSTMQFSCPLNNSRVFGPTITICIVLSLLPFVFVCYSGFGFFGKLRAYPSDAHARAEVRVIRSAAGLSREQEAIIARTRLSIRAELQGYNFKNRTLESLLYEAGGQPARTVIFTSWRSGSTFLSTILERNRGTYLYFEPLCRHGWVQFQNDTDGRKAFKELSALLQCDYHNLSKYTTVITNHGNWSFYPNLRVARHCQGSNLTRLCSNQEFLSRMCRLFPFQLTKLVRMRLSIARWLLEDPNWNARIIYLVRDPRAVLASRRTTFNCSTHVCGSAATHCRGLEDDYATAKQLTREFPDRFRVVRYEKLALNPVAAVKTIFKFNQWDYDGEIEEFVKTHTTHHGEGPFNSFRKSDVAVFGWRNRLNRSQVKYIQSQSHCSQAIRNWGYSLLTEQDELETFNPVDTFEL